MGTETLVRRPQKIAHGSIFDISQGLHRPLWITSLVVTGDENEIKFVTCEAKKQSMEWSHTSSPKKSRKGLKTFSLRKIMATVFWDTEGVILADFLVRAETINDKKKMLNIYKIKKKYTK